MPNSNAEQRLIVQFVLSRAQAPESSVSLRLDRIVTDYLINLADEQEEEESWLVDAAASRTKVHRWIKAGYIQVNGVVVSKVAFEPRVDDIITITVPEPTPTRLIPDKSIPLDIVYEDESLIVVNKQARLVVHPGAGGEDQTLVHALLAHLGPTFGIVGSPDRPGIVHRLDRDTTGLLVVAKTQAAYQHLVAQFVERKVARTYLALTLALPRGGHVIDLPIGRNSRNRKIMDVVEKGGKRAITRWQLRKDLVHGKLLELSLETGRTHQIRVHLKARLAGIVGDPLYGPAPRQIPKEVQKAVSIFGRQALHATTLRLIHPLSEEKIEFSAEVPPDFAELLTRFSGSGA